MKRLLLTVFLACTGLFPLYSQYPQLANGERQRLAALANDQLRCDTLNEWAFQRNGAASLPYAEAALALAGQTGYANGRADAYVRLGQAAAHSGDNAGAEQYYRRSMALRDSLHDTPGVAACYNQLGLLRKRRGEYRKAIDLYQQGLALLEGKPPHVTAAVLHNNAGTAYRYLGRYDLATAEFSACMAVYDRLRAVPGANRTEISVGMASLRLSIAVLLQENSNQFSAAHDSLEKSLADFKLYQRPDYLAKCYLVLGNNAYYARNFPEAIRYYDQALGLKDHLSADDQGIVRKNQGRIYLDQRNFKKAETAFQVALDTFLRTKNQRELASTYYEIGNLHYENNALPKAVDAYR
ncbi:MAG: tetratricopeptide repeat protein, partial [Saprospiraceae bacterium]